MADFAPFIVTVQVVDAPAHAPLQPVKLEPVAATAVSVTRRAVGEGRLAGRAAVDAGRAARDDAAAACPTSRR